MQQASSDAPAALGVQLPCIDECAHDQLRQALLVHQVAEHAGDCFLREDVFHLQAGCHSGAQLLQRDLHFCCKVSNNENVRCMPQQS